MTIAYSEHYFNKHGEEHRTGKPASIWYDTNGEIVREQYYKQGATHREDGPAILTKDGYFYMWLSQYHRYDGPAIMRTNNNETFVFWSLHDVGPAEQSSSEDKAPTLWPAFIWTHFHNNNGIGVDKVTTRESCLTVLMDKNYLPKLNKDNVHSAWEFMDEYFEMDNDISTNWVKTMYVDAMIKLGAGRLSGLRGSTDK